MNKIGGNINHIKNVVNGFIPSVKKESFIFDWSEINSVIDSINSAWNKFKVVQLTEFFFTVFLWNFNKLTDSGQSEPSIIFGDDSQVVLDQHSMKIISMSLKLFIILLWSFQMNHWKVQIYRGYRRWYHMLQFLKEEDYWSK